MNTSMADRVAAAVLYEGYLLYPYRASALKNQKRFNFGVLMPDDYCQRRDENERSDLQTECLVQGTTPLVTIKLRHLQLQHRQIKQQSGTSSSHDEAEPVAELLCSGRKYHTWDEAIERELMTPTFSIKSLTEVAIELPVTIEAGETVEPIQHTYEPPRGWIVRTWQRLEGRLEISAVRLATDLFRLQVRIRNLTSFPESCPTTREEALPWAYLSAHLILRVSGGKFVSLLEPPDELTAEAKGCAQIGCWPVLVGDEGDRRTMLVSPIILYDYPQVAPESAGDFFDAAEIDEMLMLRVLTMTPEEQLEMEQTDDQARRLLERARTLPPERMASLHGAWRGQQSTQTVSSDTQQKSPETSPFDWSEFESKTSLQSVDILGVPVRVGDRVRLWPKQKKDIFDMALENQVAMIEAIEEDYDGQVHLAVVLDDDPGRDLGLLRQPGHRFFFSTDEVVPLSMSRNSMSPQKRESP